MLKLQRRWRGGVWRALCAGAVAGLLLPAGASATTFSFGDVYSTDVITSLHFAPSSTKTSFDPGTGIMHVEAYLVQINFANRDPITGIDADDVLLTSEIMLVGSSFAVSQSALNNPRSFSATFTNGLLDLSIFDTVSMLSLLDTDYDSDLSVSATEVGTQPITGELSGNLISLGSSDPDFLSAFGPFGQLDANFSGFFSDGASVGFNLCNLVKAGVTVYPNPPSPQTCAGGYALDDFTTNAVITIIPIPEPGTALLFGLGLAGVAARRRK